MQTNLDLRAAIAAAAEAEQAALETPTAAPAAADRPRKPQLPRPGRAVKSEPRTGCSPDQIRLIRTMLLERFSEAEATRRFEAFVWTKMPSEEFNQILGWVKALPKLNREYFTQPRIERPNYRDMDRPAQPVRELVEGRFTVSFADGSYRTLRVQRQDADDKFMPGRLLISYLSGSDNDNDYTGFAHVTERGTVVIWKKHRENTSLDEAVKVLAGDPKAAAQAYFEQTGECVACGRTISRPDSIEDAKINGGLGPDCVKRYSW